MRRSLWVLGVVVLLAVGLLTACSNDPPGLRACNYFRGDYLDAFLDIQNMENMSLSLVREEAEKLDELAQETEPGIKTAAAALLESVIRENEPHGDTHMPIQLDVVGACLIAGHWEVRRPPPN